jgi:hypothetical protein
MKKEVVEVVRKQLRDLRQVASLIGYIGPCHRTRILEKVEAIELALNQEPIEPQPSHSSRCIP